MALPPYRSLVNFRDRVSSRDSNNIDSALRVISDKEIIDGNLLQNVFLDGGVTTTVGHGLGRTPFGWIVVSADAAATYYEGDTSDSTALYLVSSSDVTVSLWVF